MSYFKSVVFKFSRQYIAFQVRDGNLFLHESQAFPPSLSGFGKLQQGIIADLLSCLENSSEPVSSQPNAIVVILNEQWWYKSAAVKTFYDDVVEVLLYYIQGQLQNFIGVDIVWGTSKIA